MGDYMAWVTYADGTEQQWRNGAIIGLGGTGGTVSETRRVGDGG